MFISMFIYLLIYFSLQWCKCYMCSSENLRWIWNFALFLVWQYIVTYYLPKLSTSEAEPPRLLWEHKWNQPEAFSVLYVRARTVHRLGALIPWHIHKQCFLLTLHRDKPVLITLLRKWFWAEASSGCQVGMLGSFWSYQPLRTHDSWPLASFFSPSCPLSIPNTIS